MLTKETRYTVDRSVNKIVVEREFEAPPELVWRAWSEPALLDQWWAPKPWKAITKTMDFRSGGHWLYYMEGPDGARHYCRADFTLVEPGKKFIGDDSFCDEQGVTQPEPPGMHWEAVFQSSGTGTRVTVEIRFASPADLDKIVEMGFKEGFAAAHGNLDQLLKKTYYS